MDSNQQEIHIISNDPHDADIEILEASSPTSCHNLVASATTTMTENPAMHRGNGAEMPPHHDNTSDSDSHPRRRRQPCISSSSSSSSLSPRSLSMQRAMLMMDRALTRSTKIGAAIVQLELSRASGRQQASQVSSLRTRRYTMPDEEQQQQDQQHEGCVRNANVDDNAQQEGYKRRRVSSVSVSAPADNAAALSSLSLCERQGALPPRTQRLSALLQHLQVTHQLLMEEMQARFCCTEVDDEEDDDNDNEYEGESHH